MAEERLGETGAPACTSCRVQDYIGSGLILLDEAGRVVRANPRALAIFGKNALPEGTPIDSLLAPLSELKARGGSAELVRHRVKSPEGQSIGFQLLEVPPLDGDPVRFAVLFQDLGAFDALRQERDRLLQLAAVGEVLPAVLHEIKNPLAAITTEVEVLLEEVEGRHVRRQLEAVLGEVRRIKLALEGIGLFRTELRTPRLAAIDQALREAFLVTEHQLRSKGVKGLLDVPELPLLPLDPAGIRAIAFNLLTNALHACRQGDTVRLESRLVDEGSTFELNVIDTGTGMTPEVLRRCRELFFTTKSNGSGLGLALCSRVAEESGGSLEVESKEATGTRIRVRVPAAGRRKE